MTGPARCKHDLLEGQCGACKEPPRGSRLHSNGRTYDPDDWSPAEDAILADHMDDYPEHTPPGKIAELAALLSDVGGRKRSVKAVGNRLWMLRGGAEHVREQREDAQAHASHSGDEWTDGEIQAALDPSKTAYEIAIEIGRTVAGVGRIRRDYGGGRDYRRKDG